MALVSKLMRLHRILAPHLKMDPGRKHLRLMRLQVALKIRVLSNLMLLWVMMLMLLMVMLLRLMGRRIRVPISISVRIRRSCIRGLLVLHFQSLTTDLESIHRHYRRIGTGKGIE